MAWGVKQVEYQRELFCMAIMSGKLNIAQACRQFQISRPTGYEWLERFKMNGVSGLSNLNSQRKTQSHKTSEIHEDMIVSMKARYGFGPKKIYAHLCEHYPEECWPKTTTIHNILLRNGLVQNKRTKLLLAEKNYDLQESVQPNDIWSMDFKGWFITKDSVKYEPFTLMDHHTRYLIRSNNLKANNTNYVWGILNIAFMEYGLPLYLRSDNGTPFSSLAPGRISKLAVKLIKAGVTPEWVEPGKPQQNGRHERMHKTMKENGFLLGSNLKEQTQIMRDFVEFYNFERPHEALEQKTPGSLYVPSTRIWSGRLNEIEYTEEFKVLRVRSCGKASWNGGNIYVSRALEGETVGIKEGDDGLEMYFANIYLGTVNKDNTLNVKRRPGRRKKN